MKKTTITIAALALSASTSFALIGPGGAPMESRTYCLKSYTDFDGSANAITCDETANNETEGRTILGNGCAEDQMSLTTAKSISETRYPVEIGSCLPPNVVQL